MEVKLVISVDDKTADLIKSLVNAIAVKGAASVKCEEKRNPEAKVESKAKLAGKAKSEAVTEEVDTKDSKFTLDDVRKALAEAKHRCGNIEPCKAVVKKYGASGLSSLDPAHYTEVIAALTEL